MGSHEVDPRLAALIAALDRAASDPGTVELCRNVVRELEGACRGAPLFLREDFLRTAPDGYARHLLHRDPDGRYSVVVMVWDGGQGTPLHDHGGRWCVECVYQGRIRVVSHEHLGRVGSDGLVRFRETSRIYAGVGEAGALIPPREHHLIENPDETPAVTIHVYEGEMESCNAFEPVEGDVYRPVRKELTYTV